jgi:D-beta-D-heptose 7-phosphate kinase/D-beta-D-heptose 1-phosphate adenosyltransferase
MDKKIKSASVLSRLFQRLRRQGQKIVFTNGCFDILHVGHVTYLKKAKALGDVLVVGLNSDRSVRALKGKGRPVNRQLDRATVLAAMASVDYVAIFDEDTPLRLIEALKPDILVKGGDWKTSAIVGSDFVKARGGRVLRIPFVDGYSTTSTIKRLAR